MQAIARLAKKLFQSHVNIKGFVNAHTLDLCVLKT